MRSDSPPPSPEHVTISLPRFGRYELLTELGAGGMGEVYLARDTQLGREVALKVLPPERMNDAEAVARFQREAMALAQLSHPNIVQAYDTGEEDGKHFLVMEFVEGTSLDKLLREKGALAPGRAADFAYQAAQALQHAHEKGLIHRDVKPSNLLVTSKGAVKLLDLGLSRFLQDQIVDGAVTHEGIGMGTPDYAAPEQFRDAHSADERADVYELGCTLYHLLTGKPPFPGSSFHEKYEAHAKKKAQPVEEINPDVPGGVAMVVEKMMAKQPIDRFQTAAEVTEALSPFVAGSSVQFESIRSTSKWRLQAPTTPQGRISPRRLPWAIAFVAVLALAVTFLGFVTPGWFRKS